MRYFSSQEEAKSLFAAIQTCPLDTKDIYITVERGYGSNLKDIQEDMEQLLSSYSLQSMPNLTSIMDSFGNKVLTIHYLVENHANGIEDELIFKL